MLELGGNIFLDNFDETEPGRLIIVKKIVGNYTKEISEKVKKFKKIIVSLEKGDKIKVKVKVEAEKEFSGEGEGGNLFFALDSALAEVLKSVNQ